MKINFHLSQTFRVIILSISFGLIAGFLGLVIFGLNNFKIPFLGTINYADPNLNQSVVIQQPRSVVLEQDLQIQKLENTLLPTMLNVYTLKKQSTDPLTSAYSEQDLLGRAFALTSDGWLITSAKVVGNVKLKYAVVGYQNKLYETKEIIIDNATGLAFIKIDASNQPVAKIGSSNNLHVGQTVGLIDSRHGLSLSNVAKIGYSLSSNKNLIFNSDLLNKRIYLNSTGADSNDGSVLVNLKGEVVGIMSSESIVPTDSFEPVINQLLGNKKIIRPSLDIDYIDLSQVDGVVKWGDKGAYVVYEPIKGTAGYGLIKKSDVIKKVNDRELNSFVSLAEAISQFRVGDRIDLLVSRGGQDVSIQVILK